MREQLSGNKRTQVTSAAKQTPHLRASPALAASSRLSELGTPPIQHPPCTLLTLAQGMEGGLYGYQRSNLGPGGMPKPPSYPAASNAWQDDGQLVGSPEGSWLVR